MLGFCAWSFWNNSIKAGGGGGTDVEVEVVWYVLSNYVTPNIGAYAKFSASSFSLVFRTTI